MLPEAYINIGLIYLLHLDRHFESIDEFTQAIKVNPLDIRPYMCRAQAYQRVRVIQRFLRISVVGTRHPAVLQMRCIIQKAGDLPDLQVCRT